jgi:prepilin-type N-terminal cleavage/methylation domain-containing protein
MADPMSEREQRPPAAGFTFLEVIIAMAVLAVCLVPAMEALRGSLGLLGVQETISMDDYALLAKSETVLAESFTALDNAAAAAGGPTTPTSYSDLFTTADGRQLTRNVYLWPMDGDNADLDADLFTGTDPGILYVKVALANTPLYHEAIAVRQ